MDDQLARLKDYNDRQIEHDPDFDPLLLSEYIEHNPTGVEKLLRLEDFIMVERENLTAKIAAFQSAPKVATSVSLSVTPLSIKVGETLDLVATVTVNSPNAGIPAGGIEFFINHQGSGDINNDSNGSMSRKYTPTAAGDIIIWVD